MYFSQFKSEHENIIMSIEFIEGNLKKRIWHRCFPVNFAKFLRTPFLQNTSGGCFWRDNREPAVSSCSKNSLQISKETLVVEALCFHKTSFKISVINSPFLMNTTGTSYFNWLTCYTFKICVISLKLSCSLKPVDFLVLYSDWYQLFLF